MPSDVPELEVEPATWSEFVAAHSGQALDGWIFRGQPAWTFELTTLLHRTLMRSGRPPEDWKDAENEAIAFFKQRARGSRPGQLPADDDLLGWLSLMQHYRAPTRLLDFSASPFVAAFFAYASAADVDAVAVWAVNAVFFRSQFGADDLVEFDELGIRPISTEATEGGSPTRFAGGVDERRASENLLIRRLVAEDTSWPLPVLPTDSDPRMTAQQAVFLCVGDIRHPLAITSKEAWKHPGYAPGRWIGPETTWFDQLQPNHVVRKIRLPIEWRADAMRSLRRMGISHDALFPGLDGIGDATALHLALGERSWWRGLTP